LCNIGSAHLLKNYPHPCPSPTGRGVFRQLLIRNGKDAPVSIWKNGGALVIYDAKTFKEVN
jgi:hypothetical protein